MLAAIAKAVRYFGRVPTYSEFRLYLRTDPDFPAHSTISNHFAGKRQMVADLREWIDGKPDFADIAPLLPAIEPAPASPPVARTQRVVEGFVYLIKSGEFYKIGRSDDLERRVKEIRIALPDKAELVHSIRTDDPPGIEAYWHRRFAERRANGEWFKLTSLDVAAFRKRKFQ